MCLTIQFFGEIINSLKVFEIFDFRIQFTYFNIKGKFLVLFTEGNEGILEFILYCLLK